MSSRPVLQSGDPAASGSERDILQLGAEIKEEEKMVNALFALYRKEALLAARRVWDASLLADPGACTWGVLMD